MVHSTTVAPRWIEGSEKFWYEWENADGKECGLHSQNVQPMKAVG